MAKLCHGSESFTPTSQCLYTSLDTLNSYITLCTALWLKVLSHSRNTQYYTNIQTNRHNTYVSLADCGISWNLHYVQHAYIHLYTMEQKTGQIIPLWSGLTKCSNRLNGLINRSMCGEVSRNYDKLSCIFYADKRDEIVDIWWLFFPPQAYQILCWFVTRHHECCEFAQARFYRVDRNGQALLHYATIYV